MSKRRITFVHTSPAAIEPLKRFYTRAAPEIEVTNLLDDGILGLFSSDSEELVQRRFDEMIDTARDIYQAELVMLTCSAVTKKMLDRLRAASRIPVLKIDEPLARSAVRAGRKIGVVVSFAPSVETTRKLLIDAAAEAESEIELVWQIIPEAYRSLLAGDHGEHDRLLKAAIEQLATHGVDAIVLAQVSMARIVEGLNGENSVPIFTSLDTSLTAVNRVLEATS